MKLENQLEALLFWKGEPVTIKKLALWCGKTEAEIETSLGELETSLSQRGIILVKKGDEVTLATSPEVSATIETLTREELIRDLGKAGLETLSIIIYKGPVKRSEIDYIRGVSSSFIIRNLLVRGLIERVETKEGSGRGYAYGPTFKLLSHLGITSLSELPEYEKVQQEIEAFKATHEDAPAPESETLTEESH